MTDFYPQNRGVCSTRSHGPLLYAFCLCFYFNDISSLRPRSCFTVARPTADGPGCVQ